MRAGDHARAWALSDRALALRDPATRDDPALPYHRRWVWDGCPPDGVHVLVRCYHGLGDTLMFARFLPLLAARARSVTVEAQASLLPLLRVGFPDIAFVAFDPARPLPPADCDLEAGELPHALRARPQDAAADWLTVPPAPLPPGTIGLAHVAGDWDEDRWVPEALLAPLAAARPAVTLVARPSGLPVANPQGCPFDMVETAALVAGCALVVTVDTMIAHLAGALGRPAWLMLKHEPDWRWNPASGGSDWYPRARLYVQPQAGDWRSVAGRILADLEAA